MAPRPHRQVRDTAPARAGAFFVPSMLKPGIEAVRAAAANSNQIVAFVVGGGCDAGCLLCAVQVDYV